MLRAAASVLSALLVGAGAVLVLSALDQGGAVTVPGLLVLGVVGTLVMSNVDRRAVLEAGAAASLLLATMFRRVLTLVGTTPKLPCRVARRRSLGEQPRRGAFRRQERPDSPGKPLARAPGQD